MTHLQTTDPHAWEKKAKAFTVRSHRHLWGKNNEDPLAYLFLRGLNNRFIKDQYLGWNKFGQERPMNTWGIKARSGQDQKFLIPSGIVIPYIKDKTLLSVFIHLFNKNSHTTIMVPGSRTPCLVLGSNPDHISFITDIMDGLFLFQEREKETCVVIACDPDLPFDPDLLDSVSHAKTTVYLKENETRPGFLKNEGPLSKIPLTVYKNSTDLIQ